MYNMVISLHFRSNIANGKTANAILELFNDVGLNFDLCGQAEPLRTPFNRDDILSFWMGSNTFNGRAASVMFKKKKPLLLGQVSWWEVPLRKYNNITLLFNHLTLNKINSELKSIFNSCICIVDADYGYISHLGPQERQHVTGRLEDRMPGIFWCNYFGPMFLDFFGAKRMFDYEWYDKFAHHNGLLTYLAEDPFVLVDNEIPEEKAKQYLGSKSFGDLDLKQSHPFETQVREMPIL
ncbi:hypothetical protein [Cohnella sp. GCM10012308]|uniref:hypothetical protein n=1 Tax=Cohnella sp. GCM10012308 TaxID=3317329 RepID=UPI0036230150